MYLKILLKLRCLVAFQNRPSAPIGRDENFVYFEFLEGQFYKEKPLYVNLKETKHSFEVFFVICVFKRCIFNLEMRNTGLVYHRHRAVSLLRQPPPQALRFSQGRGERLVMKRKGPWEGYRRQAKPVVSFLPSLARTFSSRGRRLGTRQLLRIFV